MAAGISHLRNCHLLTGAQDASKQIIPPGDLLDCSNKGLLVAHQIQNGSWWNCRVL